MSGARIVHVGCDDFYRELVLRRVGFCVDECNSLVGLVNALKTHADVVMIGTMDAPLIPSAVAIVRGMSDAPIVLFLSVLDERRQDVDLLIEPLSRPEKWLEDLEELIAVMPRHDELVSALDTSWT